MELPRAVKGEAFAARFDRFVQAFVADLAKKYARVDFALAPSAGPVTVERSEVTVDGKASNTVQINFR